MNPWAAFGLGVALAWLPILFGAALVWIMNHNAVREGRESLRKRIAVEDKAAECVVYYDTTPRDRVMFEALTR